MNINPVYSGRNQKGVTLIELMIALAIVGILAAVAIPSYNSYITTSKMGVALSNAESLAGFVRTYYYEYNTHPVGEYTPGGTDTLRSTLEWDPQGDKDQFKYVIAACSGMTKKQCVDITATYINDPTISQTVTISP